MVDHKRITTFIDWDSAQRIVTPNLRQRRSSDPHHAIELLQDSIAATLRRYNDSASKTYYRVRLRFYHGWYSGKTKTQNRRDFDTNIEALGIARTIRNVNFEPDIEYCDYLLSDYDNKHPLYDTLRRRDDSKYEQKLIDTALTCDVLHYIRNEDASLAIVIGDDDDLLPCVFTAKHWKRKAIILRIGRRTDNQHLNTEGIIFRS
ncbi:MAG: hypothetical protein ACO37W_10265 [Prochlorotrichaceae cyanobacterium]